MVSIVLGDGSRQAVAHQSADIEQGTDCYRVDPIKGADAMPYVMVDVEADGPIPGDYSMVSFGAVLVEPELQRTFYGRLRPISERFVPEALAVSGFTRDECLAFEEPRAVMQQFRDWLEPNCRGRMLFIADNNGFDWQFINWYFHHFLGKNPFGFSSTNLGSLYKGLQRDASVNFKHLRKTKHTHHPVDDARGNAEALLRMREMGLKLRLD
jgi:DNA polymerase III epsilon subunit-like protein